MATSFLPNILLTEGEKELIEDKGFLQRIAFLMRESGYMHIQATKPDTVGKSYTILERGLSKAKVDGNIALGFAFLFAIAFLVFR